MNLHAETISGYLFLAKILDNILTSSNAFKHLVYI